MASTTATTRIQPTAGASSVGDSSRTSWADHLRHVDQQIQRMVVLLAPHRHELELLHQALKRLAATRPPSPYEHIREGFAEQANDIRCHWEQVGFHLQRAMEQMEKRQAEKVAHE